MILKILKEKIKHLIKINLNLRLGYRAYFYNKINEIY